jgi:hypothetical protein
MPRTTRKNPDEEAADAKILEPNSISRADFMRELEAARVKAGGVYNLSIVIGAQPRMINYWLAGEGPTQKRMIALYVNLRNINWDEALQKVQAQKSLSHQIQEQ